MRSGNPIRRLPQRQARRARIRQVKVYVLKRIRFQGLKAATALISTTWHSDTMSSTSEAAGAHL